MLSIHLELLDEKHRRVFDRLGALKEQLYLSGGTALSLQIAHRLSYDFDLFLSRALTRADRVKVKSLFRVDRVNLDIPDQLDLIVEDEVKITLLYFQYQPSEPLVPTGSIGLASVTDIALDKAFSLGRRAVWRDYVDLFFLLRDWLSLDKVIELAGQKFGSDFNPKFFLEQLCYFDDLELAPIAFLGSVTAPAEVKAFLLECVRDFREREIPSF